MKYLIKTISLAELSSPSFSTWHVNPDTHLNHSLDTIGMLQPIVVNETSSGKWQLIDGKKRVFWLKEKQESEVQARVITNLSLETLCECIFALHQEKINDSMMSKLEFCFFCLNSGFPKKTFLSQWANKLEIKAHSASYVEFKKIQDFPNDLKQFCSQKKFSYRQLVHLASTPKTLRAHIWQSANKLQLSASILEELFDRMTMLLKRHRWSLETLSEALNYHEILDASSSPSERTKKIRSALYMLSYPILNEVNTKIKSITDSLKTPIQTFSWDPSLEEKYIEVTYKLKTSSDLLTIKKEANLLNSPLQELLSLL